MRSAVKYPSTVNRTGGQTRAFIHIQDTVGCIKIALDTPLKQGERVEICNQITETHRVKEEKNRVSIHRRIWLKCW